MSEPQTVKQSLDQIISLWLAGSPHDTLVRKWCELSNTPDEELARESVRQLIDGYNLGWQLGRTLRLSGSGVTGSPLFLAGFDRGHWAGTKNKFFFKILPLCLLLLGWIVFRAK